MLYLHNRIHHRSEFILFLNYLKIFQIIFLLLYIITKDLFMCDYDHMFYNCMKRL